jgi:hypothetical protein
MSSIQFYDVVIKMYGKVSISLEDEYFLFSRYFFHEAQSTVFRGAMIGFVFHNHLEKMNCKLLPCMCIGFRLNVCLNYLSLRERIGKAVNMLCFLCKVTCFFPSVFVNIYS